MMSADEPAAAAAAGGAVMETTPKSWGSLAGAVGERVGSYPVVRDSLTKIADVYRGAKESSRIVQLAGGVAESGVRVVCATARPIAEATMGPVNMMSEMSVKSLDSLERAVPLITEPSDKVISTVTEGAQGLYQATIGTRVDRARSAVTGAKQYGEEQFKAARDLREKAIADVRSYALARAERGETAFNRAAEKAHLDALIEYVDSMLDYLLPAGAEATETVSGAVSPARPVYPRDPSRVLLGMPAKLTRGVRARGKKARVQLSTSLAEVRDNLAGLTSTLDLITLLNNRAIETSGSVKVKVDQAKETLAAYYAEAVRKMKLEEGAEEATLDRRILVTMRSLASGVQTRFSDLLLTPALTDTLRSKVLAAKTSAESTLQWVNKVTGVSDFSSDMVTKIQTNVSLMVQTYGSLIDSALSSSSSLNWTGLNKYLSPKHVEGEPQETPTNGKGAPLLEEDEGDEYSEDEDDLESTDEEEESVNGHGDESAASVDLDDSSLSQS